MIGCLDMLSSCKFLLCIFYQFNNIRKVFDNGNLKRKPSMGTGTWSDFGNRYLPAPTQSLLQKWLRENYQIDITIEVLSSKEENKEPVTKY